jgi:hypothetical protein
MDTPAAEVEDRPQISTVINSDDEILGELGYRQEFKRKFSLWSIFGLSFATLGLLPSVAATMGYALG